VVPLGDVCTVIAGQSPDGSAYNNRQDGLPFYQGKKEFTDRFLGPATTWTTQVTKIAEANDILMSVRAPVGPINLSTERICIGRGLAAIRPKPGLDVGFLWYALLWMQPQITGSEGAVFASINRNQICALSIPLPPLDEQKRIVAVLDEAFEGLSRARANAEANLADARELYERFLSGLMSSDSGSWTTYSFGDPTVLQIVDGDRGANYPQKSDFMPEGHCLFLSTKNVRPDGFSFAEKMFISEDRDRALRKGKLRPRDVILTTRGTIGNVAFFDETVPYEHIRINSGMLILRPNEEKVRAEFLFELLRSGVIKEQIAEHVSGAAQPQLPIRSLVKFSLPAPKSTTGQLHIVEQLKRLSDETTHLVDEYLGLVQELDTLRQSLLQKAFSGELT
jgi:type I restriction enzyme S subunit